MPTVASQLDAAAKGPSEPDPSRTIPEMTRAFQDACDGRQIHTGQTYKDVINEFDRVQAATGKPYNAAQAVFITDQGTSMVSGLDDLRKLTSQPGFSDSLKLSFMFLHAAKGAPTYYALDNVAKTVCRIDKDSYYNTTKIVEPTPGR